MANEKDKMTAQLKELNKTIDEKNARCKTYEDMYKALKKNVLDRNVSHEGRETSQESAQRPMAAQPETTTHLPGQGRPFSRHKHGLEPNISPLPQLLVPEKGPKTRRNHEHHNIDRLAPNQRNAPIAGRQTSSEIAAIARASMAIPPPSRHFQKHGHTNTKPRQTHTRQSAATSFAALRTGPRAIGTSHGFTRQNASGTNGVGKSNAHNPTRSNLYGQSDIEQSPHFTRQIDGYKGY